MKATEPTLSPSYMVAYNLLKSGIDPEQLERGHFDALVGKAGEEKIDLQAKYGFAQDAIAQWGELRALGIHYQYQVAKFFDARSARSDLRAEAGSVESDFAALAGFLEKANAASVGKALDMIAGTAKGAMKRLDAELETRGARGDFADVSVALSKLTTLKTIALNSEAGPEGEQIRAKAGALADDLFARYGTFAAARSFASVVDELGRSYIEPGFEHRAGEAARRLAESEPARATALRQLEKSSSPEERERLIAALSRASISQVDALALRDSLALAKHIWAIDHKDEPFAPKFGSHPLLPALFAAAGTDVKLVLTDGASLEGRVVMAKDYDENKAGSEPMLGLHHEGQVLDVRLPAVAKITAGERLLFDAAATGAVMARAFSPLDGVQQGILGAISGQDVVGDYSVDHKRVSQLAAMVADKIPGARQLLDSLKAQDLPQYMEQMTSGAIVGRYLISMLALDLGPKTTSELAVAAFGAVNGYGYKSWAIDVREELRQGGGGLSKAVAGTGDAAYGMLGLLQSGPVADRIEIIEREIAGLGAKFASIQKRGVPVAANVAQPFLNFWKQDLAA